MGLGAHGVEPLPIALSGIGIHGALSESGVENLARLGPRRLAHVQGAAQVQSYVARSCRQIEGFEIQPGLYARSPLHQGAMRSRHHP